MQASSAASKAGPTTQLKYINQFIATWTRRREAYLSLHRHATCFWRSRFGLSIQPRSSVFSGKSAWDHCRQRRSFVALESSYWLAPVLEARKTTRLEPMRSAGPQLPCSLGEPHGWIFDAAEVYDSVCRLQL